MSTDNEALRLGIVPLRPLALADLLKGTTEALRRNASALFGTALLVAIAAGLVTALVTVLALGGVPQAPTVISSFADARPFLIATAIATLVNGTFGVLLIGVVNIVVPRAVFGHTTGFAAGLWAVAPRLLSLFGVFLLVTGMIVGVGAVGLGAAIADPVGVLVFLGAMVGIIYASAALAFASSVVVVEGLDVLTALRRSRALVHAVGWWRVFGIMLLAGAVAGLAGILLDAVFAAVSGGAAVGVTLATVITSAVFAPVTAVLQSLLYVDHRCRSEGIEGLWRESA
ncbi:putative integral membrane protein [Alloactinosynnema sp. L-07]|uniref:hypothetical protein n=1 Tax=Alloactinosynnema sp. L-07 TaxID=1653480 RepID=UPI00065F00ED|nr:hypothetical protein [Alloactinosynnema sp. L-07]CRK58563.1 putative integral membrane protein [Alloactinosynnema sp. L-07]